MVAMDVAGRGVLGRARSIENRICSPPRAMGPLRGFPALVEGRTVTADCYVEVTASARLLTGEW